MKFKPTEPWRFLDEFRGKEFDGKWPNVKRNVPYLMPEISR